MKNDNAILSTLFVILIFFSAVGVFLIKANAISNTILSDYIDYLRVLKDPSTDINGRELIGSQFLDVSLNDIDGNKYRISEIQALFKIIVIFRVEDCNVCLNEYRLWSALYEKFPVDCLCVIAICESRDLEETIRFVKNRAISFPVLFDPNRKIRQETKVKYSPIRLLLDEDNKVIEISQVGLAADQQRALISSLEERITNRKKLIRNTVLK